jgi:hypothetical protein
VPLDQLARPWVADHPLAEPPVNIEEILRSQVSREFLIQARVPLATLNACLKIDAHVVPRQLRANARTLLGDAAPSVRSRGGVGLQDEWSIESLDSAMKLCGSRR